MKALVYHGRKDVRYEDVELENRVGSHDVRLRVKAAGLCHTDFNEYAHGPLYIAQTPHVRTGRSIPLVIGHEFSGEVVEVGTEVREFRAGDRVAVNAVDSCRHCFYCRRSLYALCPTAAYIGFGRDGGFAEFAVVPALCCHRLAPNVSDQAGALVEPLSVALHAVRQAGTEVGSRVAVVGGGAIGLCTLQALRAVGVRDVLVLEKAQVKARFSEELGATAVLNPDQVDPRAAVQDLTDGLGADFTFECVGSAQALRTAVSVTRPGGTVCVAGVFPEAFEFDFNDLLSQEKKIVTSIAYGDEFPLVIGMLADGRLKAEPLITNTVPLADALEKGLFRLENLAATNVRTMIAM
ncbi:MAG: 2,3-butanediol dehydrogenase [Acidobacteriota bacterium]